MPEHKTLTWLFDLDNTLHDASHAVFGRLDMSMTEFVARELNIDHQEANRLRHTYWQRYGATLLGLERHHGIRAAHFLHDTHRLPGLEAQLRLVAADRAALRQLPGRKFILTNAPAAYARRVLDHLHLSPCFEGVVSIEGMRMFGHLRPKPDARMLQKVLAQLRLTPAWTVLVEDTLGHLRSARSLGMRTVWMQRYVKVAGHGPEVGIHLHRRPPYVCARISTLRDLYRWTVHTNLKK